MGIPKPKKAEGWIDTDGKLHVRYEDAVDANWQIQEKNLRESVLATLNNHYAQNDFYAEDAVEELFKLFKIEPREPVPQAVEADQPQTEE